MASIRALEHRGGLRMVIALALSLVTALVGVTGSARAQQTAGALSVADWARQVWSTARAGEEDRALALIGRLPADHEAAGVRALRESLEQRNRNLTKADEQRVTRVGEVRAEIQKHMASDEMLAALRFAVELHALSTESEKPAVLADPMIKDLVQRAERQAREAEQKNQWLDAQELLYRLHLLYEEDGRYKADVERVGQRLMMLRLYTPRRLHEMRSQQRVKEGEQALPPFNPIGEDWKEKLNGISKSMLQRALLTAASSHVDGIGMTEVLRGGLTALRTMATTNDLAETFDGLSNTGARDRFVRAIDEEAQRLETRRDGAGYFDLTQTLDAMTKANGASVRIPEEALIHEFGNGAMSRLDEFSAMIWPDEIRRFERTTQGRFTGIGVQISLDDAMQLMVVTPLEGTPAQRAGLRRGDIIRSVDGESTLGISTNQAVDKITGDEGTRVRLSIERPGVEGLLDYTITRAVIPIYSVKGWRRTGAKETDWDWFVDPEYKIGYLRLTQFSEDTTRELMQAVGEMRRSGLSGLILDLRFNPGGLLNEAVSVANLFVDDGLIVSQHDASGVERDAQRARPGMAVLADLPVIVLVNEGSASASEIVAGCLQDYGRAVLVGARTFGKGSVQNVYPLAQGRGALKLTTQYYRLPQGRLIHRRDGKATWGVEPDVHVPMMPQQINDSLTLRMDADVMPLDENGKMLDDPKRPDPERLLTEGLDPQLETAVLLLRSQCLGKTSGHAMLERSLFTGS